MKHQYKAQFVVNNEDGEMVGLLEITSTIKPLDFTFINHTLIIGFYGHTAYFYENGSSAMLRLPWAIEDGHVEIDWYAKKGVMSHGTARVGSDAS